MPVDDKHTRVYNLDYFLFKTGLITAAHLAAVAAHLAAFTVAAHLTAAAAHLAAFAAEVLLTTSFLTSTLLSMN